MCKCESRLYRPSTTAGAPCIPCPDKLNCLAEGTTLATANLQPNTWRASNDDDAFLACPVNGTCVGGVDADHYCLAGHHGPLCAICNDNFTRPTNSVPCASCPEDMAAAVGWSIASLIICAGLLVLFLIINRRAPDGLLRPLISAMQQLMVVLTFPVDWPESIKAIGTLLSGISLDFVSIASPSCLGIQLNYNWRFGLLVIFTALILGGPWLFSYLRHRRNNEKWEGAIKARFRDTFLLIVLLHPTVSGQAFYHFRCQSVGNTSYLVVDYTLTCDDTTWYVMLLPVISVIVFFSLGVPLIFAEVLRRRKHKLHEAKTMKLLGVLYKGYKPELYWFESVTMLFKLALWATLVFFEEGSQFQLATASALCFIQVGIHAKFEPYKNPLKNWLQYVGLILVASTSFSGLVLNYLEVSKDFAVLQGDKVKIVNSRLHIRRFKTAITVFIWTGIILTVARLLYQAYKLAMMNRGRVSRASTAVVAFARRRMPSRSRGASVELAVVTIESGRETKQRDVAIDAEVSATTESRTEPTRAAAQEEKEIGVIGLANPMHRKRSSAESIAPSLGASLDSRMHSSQKSPSTTSTRNNGQQKESPGGESKRDQKCGNNRNQRWRRLALLQSSKSKKLGKVRGKKGGVGGAKATGGAGARTDGDVAVAATEQAVVSSSSEKRTGSVDM